MQFGVAQDIRAKAGTNSAITYSLFGDAVLSGVDGFSLLAQGQLSTSTAILYTSAASTQTLLKEIQLANTTASPVTGVTFYANGSAPTNQLNGGFTIPANGSAVYAGGVWQIYDSVGALITTSTITLTGDATGTGTATIVVTLATVNSNTGPWGSASQVPTFTVNAKGLITAAANVSILIAESQVTNLVSDLAGKVPTTRNINTTAPITGGGDLSADRTLALTTSPVGQTPVGVTRNINTTAPITGGGDLSADRTLALTTSPAGQTPVGVTRNINTTAPITGGGDLSADRTLALTTSPAGQTPVGVTRLITTTTPLQIAGGTSADLSADRTLSILPATISLAGSMSANDKKKLNLLVYDVVADYGADPTGVADSATAIQNAVNAAQTAGYGGGSGGIVWFPAGRYKTTTTIIVTGHGIKFWGTNAGWSVDFGAYYVSMGSAIVPSGAFTAVQVLPVQTNGLSGVPNTGFGWSNVGIDCYANNGTIGLQMLSCVGFDIDNFYCINPTGTGLDMNCLQATKTTTATVNFPLSAATINVSSTAANGTGPAFANSGSVVIYNGSGTGILVTYTGKSGTTLTGCSSGGTGSAAIGSNVTILPGAQDTTRGHVGRLAIRTIEGGGVAIRMDGDGAGIANTNLISWNNSIVIAHLNGIGIKDINSDTNLFENVIINRATGGTAAGVEIGAAATAVGASRNNVFKHLSPGAGGVVARGTPTAAFASGPTYIWDYQLANGEARPTIEAGAQLYYTYNGAWALGGIIGTPAIVDQGISAATLTLITGSLLPIPPQGLLAGTVLRLTMIIDKTNVGTAATSLFLKIGTLGTTGDATIATFTLGTGTAAADSGKFVIDFTVRTNIGAGSAALGSLNLTKNAGTIVGWDILPTRNIVGTMATFNSTTAAQFLSAAITSGATVVPTVRQCYWECIKPGI